MSEWKEWNGRDEQIAEMENAQHGVLISSYPSDILDLSDMFNLPQYLNELNITSYLICDPHPLANMICQQALTGQPVWMRRPTWLNEPNNKGHRWIYHEPTCKPIWDLPDTEYSFTKFKEEV